MKTHKIDPNKIRANITNFTVEFRYAEKPKGVMLGLNDAINQRWLRLVEIPMTGEAPKKTMWHEIYAEDLSSNTNFAKWIKKRCRQFAWSGKPKDFYKLSEIMGSMASREIVAKRGLATTNEPPISPEEE
jgi:hypothetical protein